MRKYSFQTLLISFLTVLVIMATGLWAKFAISHPHPSLNEKLATRKVSVQVIKPAIEDLDIKLRYPVNIQAIFQANILPTALGGYLTEVRVDKGDYVTKGQLLAVIDPSIEEEKVKQVEEAVNQAEANYKNSELTLQRYREMRKNDFISQQEVDNAELVFEVAKANLGKAKADLRQMKVQLKFTSLTAPFSGYVTNRYLDPGAMVTPSSTTPVLTLMKIDTLRVQVNVSEQDSHYIRQHLKAEFMVDAYPGKVFRGEVARFAHAIDPISRTLLVEIDIPNTDLLLKPGMYGRLNLIVDRHPGSILLPAEAILFQESGASLFEVEKGKAKRVIIKTGYDGGEFLEVTSGLTGQEEVILSGQDMVTDGTSVDAVPVIAHSFSQTKPVS